MSKQLHIIAFDIPSLPLYGGTIDIFYKIKSFHQIGIAIILHCFDYGEHKSIEEIKPYCKEIKLYKRKSILQSLFSTEPYIVCSRRHKDLLSNLCKDKHPILMEGIHTTAYIQHPALADRIKWVWNHNIEHDYYSGLIQTTSNPIKKLYFLLEALRLKKYYQKLQAASGIIGVSKKDATELKGMFKQVHYIPAFNKNSQVNCKVGHGSFILYHGNLSVSENANAVKWLLEKVFSKISTPIIIAGKAPGRDLINDIKRLPHVTLMADIDEQQMNELKENAHIHTLITFQDTGIKHKLLNALFTGRFVLANKAMVNGTGLESLTVQADTAEEIIQTIQRLMGSPFSTTDIEQRKKILGVEFNNQLNIKKLEQLIFGY